MCMSPTDTIRVTDEASDFRLGKQSGLNARAARTATFDPEQTSNDVRSLRCLRRLYNDTVREAPSNPGGLPNRRTGNGKCHRKIAPGFRTGKNEPAAAHSELEPRGSRGGWDGAGSQGRGQAARGPLRQPHLL